MRTITIAVCPEYNDLIVMPPAGYLHKVDSMGPAEYKGTYQLPKNRPTLDEGFYHMHLIELSDPYQRALQNKIANQDILGDPKVQVLADDTYNYGSTPVRRIFYGVYGLPPGGWDEVSIRHRDGTWATQTWLDTMRRYPRTAWHLPLHAGGDNQAKPKKAAPAKSKMPPRP